jgi:hypothetical protein
MEKSAAVWLGLFIVCLRFSPQEAISDCFSATKTLTAVCQSRTDSRWDASSMKAAQDNTSYRRVAGFIGAAIMACFLWAVGNYVIYQGSIALKKRRSSFRGLARNSLHNI